MTQPAYLRMKGISEADLWTLATAIPASPASGRSLLGGRFVRSGLAGRRVGAGRKRPVHIALPIDWPWHGGLLRQPLSPGRPYRRDPIRRKPWRHLDPRVRGILSERPNPMSGL
jgi:hypothetical protein